MYKSYNISNEEFEGLTMRKRARIIYNPTSGKELLNVYYQMQIKLEKAGYETSAYATEN